MGRLLGAEGLPGIFLNILKFPEEPRFGMGPLSTCPHSLTYTPQA